MNRKRNEGKTASRCVLASATRLTNRYRERTQAGIVKQSKARAPLKKYKAKESNFIITSICKTVVLHDDISFFLFESIQ